MGKSDKSNQIVHEAEITRQHARYKIPATIEIDGKTYKVYDWSVSGAGIINLPEEILNKNFAKAKMIFKFDDFEIVIDNLKLEFISKRDIEGKNVTGTRFTELTPQQIAILNQIISAYLAGDIVTEDDIIHAVTRAKFMQKKEKKAEVKKGRGILMLLLIWFFIILTALFLIYVMYTRIYLVKTENAYFDSNISVIRAPSPSYIRFTKNIKEGIKIKKNQYLIFAYLIGGGIKNVKSPLSGTIYKILINNGDFRNVGEPIIAVLKKNYQVFVSAHILHKDIKKIHINDIAKIEIPNGKIFYAKVVRIEFPYNVIEQNSKPLENVYNQARNYDKVILEPINFKPSVDLINSSVTVTIDTLLNKYNWYKIDDKQNNDTENNNTENNKTKQIVVKKTEENNKTVKIMQTKQKETNKTKSVNVVINKQKKYCIIAFSSKKPINSKKAKDFIKEYNNSFVEKIGDIYELKVAYFDKYKNAQLFLDNNVKSYFKDAFIIKCKVKQND